MNPRKYSRTLQEAFGPYTDHNLQPLRSKNTDYSAGWWIAFTLVSLVSAIVVVIYA